MLSQKVEVSQHLVGGNVGSSRALGSRKMRVGITIGFYIIGYCQTVRLQDCLTVIGSPRVRVQDFVVVTFIISAAQTSKTSKT